MKVNELRSLLNSIVAFLDGANDYDVSISVQGVFTDQLTFDVDVENKRIILEEK